MCRQSKILYKCLWPLKDESQSSSTRVPVILKLTYLLLSPFRSNKRQDTYWWEATGRNHEVRLVPGHTHWVLVAAETSLCPQAWSKAPTTAVESHTEPSSLWPHLIRSQKPGGNRYRWYIGIGLTGLGYIIHPLCLISIYLVIKASWHYRTFQHFIMAWTDFKWHNIEIRPQYHSPWLPLIRRFNHLDY